MTKKAVTEEWALRIWIESRTKRRRRMKRRRRRGLKGDQ